MKNNNIELFHQKVENKELTVGVVGLGYVGLPLAIEFADKGYTTIGIDVNSNKINKLKDGQNYINDIDDQRIKSNISSGKLVASSDYSRCSECDAIFICVPTPFTVNKEPDISYVIDSTNEIAKYLKNNHIIILKSTTFPGTTEKYVRPILEATGKKAGEDFYLAFSPERIDPGNKKWNTKNTPIVVGGVNDESTEMASIVHNIAVDNIYKVDSPAVAEMEKLLENIFRSVNIALVNELAQLCDRIGINIWDVVEAASTKPFGFMPFYPGPGIGGHCILIDPYYLAWMAREYDFETKFITLAAEINEDMPFYVKSMIIREIARQPVTMANAKILILGVAFKKDVDDLRHSPALKVIELLINEGVKNINYYDPYIPKFHVGKEEFKSTKTLDNKTLKQSDIVVITTNHSSFDIEMIAENSKVVIDTRNACKHLKNKDNIVLLGDGK